MPLWPNEGRFGTAGLQGAPLNSHNQEVGEHSLPNICQVLLGNTEPVVVTGVVILTVY